MTLRDWTDPRDGRYWKLRQTGLPPVLVFTSEDDVSSVLVDFRDSLEDRSDADLQRLLDEGTIDLRIPLGRSVVSIRHRDSGSVERGVR